jgi:sugar/nucleoside kinase (ribokinase family)
VSRRYDYLAVGHVTVDVIEGRSSGAISQPGGGAFYSALQAARLGLDSLIVTRGEPRQIEQLLAPYRRAPGRLDVEVIPAEETTTLLTRWEGRERRQRVRAWAGPIERLPAVAGAIVHFAPVANETPTASATDAALVALTPQGLVRTWAGDGWIAPAPLDRARLPARLDAVVLSEDERASCAGLLDGEGAPRQALVAITAGARPVELRMPGQPPLSVPTITVECPRDDLGAGDVFAAALFTRLWRGDAPAQAVRYAGAAAAVRLQGVGPASVGRREQIEALLASS